MFFLNFFKTPHRQLIMTFCLLLVFISSIEASADSTLPDIGKSGTSSISLDEERKLGEAWLRILRGRTSQLRDPFVYEYTQDLLYQLVSHSQLADKNLTLVLLNQPSLNAFAVPGSIVGIHSGLFTYAQTEGQFASVLAHELAHLTQRHYANNVEEQRKSWPLQLATLFGAILVASTTSNSDATAAALITGQAAIVDNKLAYSRQNEREADDLGMLLLAKSGFDPDSMPNMFSQMLQSTRFQGSQVPEFLRSHPVTQSRIADSQNRAAQITEKGKSNSLTYQLIRSRVMVDLQKDQALLFKQFPTITEPTTVDHYIHVLAAIASNQAKESTASLNWLIKKNPNNLLIQALNIEYLTALEDDQKAYLEVKQLLALYPENYPLTQLLIHIMNKQQKYREVSVLLRQQLRERPNNDYLWFQLAENEGLLGHLLAVRQARAEFYLLKGDTKRAETHLKQALRQPSLSSQEKAIIEELLKETLAIRDSLDF